MIIRCNETRVQVLKKPGREPCVAFAGTTTHHALAQTYSV